MNAQTNSITVKGSAQIITEYLHFAVNSILFQRGIYPSEDFLYKEKYGITLLISRNEKVQSFLSSVLKTIEEWLPDGKLDRISMVIIDIATKKTLERWDFSLEADDGSVNTESGHVSTKPLPQIQSEIRSVIRQITSSISFLPLIEERATFDILLHPKISEYRNQAPSQWEWRSAQDITIANSQAVHMRSISTGIDKVDTAVCYRQVE